jgi:hypothetical protein
MEDLNTIRKNNADKVPPKADPRIVDARDLRALGRALAVAEASLIDIRYHGFGENQQRNLAGDLPIVERANRLAAKVGALPQPAPEDQLRQLAGYLGVEKALTGPLDEVFDDAVRRVALRQIDEREAEAPEAPVRREVLHLPCNVDERDSLTATILAGTLGLTIADQPLGVTIADQPLAGRIVVLWPSQAREVLEWLRDDALDKTDLRLRFPTSAGSPVLILHLHRRAGVDVTILDDSASRFIALSNSSAERLGDFIAAQFGA